MLVYIPALPSLSWVQTRESPGITILIFLTPCRWVRWACSCAVNCRQTLQLAMEKRWKQKAIFLFPDTQEASGVEFCKETLSWATHCCHGVNPLCIRCTPACLLLLHASAIWACD